MCVQHSLQCACTHFSTFNHNNHKMKILVINCGSSSIKYKLYEMNDKSVLAAGGIEKIGLEGSFLKTKINGETKIIESPCPTHTEGIKLMFDTLLNPVYGAIKSLDEISAAGHRIVAGGRFTKSMVVTPEMLNEWKNYMDLAPLHSEAQYLYSTLHSTKLCLPRHICMPFLTNIMKPKTYAVGVHTEQATVLSPHVCARC